eukprot:CAMPEP_0113614770 /NCGR_PEP_ID=MMETSP0017_2-20120614/7346_1 /TAXON_ID=2856 /ORGANISM="Cylindrotheca closterium" /LENGTH=60 /DNA_ID=CAMNT_0000523965 /DNA_START=402 /DNA_END=584 /DNA_ORIENTATION=+ /assembly_acc=CAM_ASM_000147
MEGEMEKDKKKRLVDAKKEKEALEILEKGKPVGTLKGNELTTLLQWYKVPTKKMGNNIDE